MSTSKAIQHICGWQITELHRLFILCISCGLCVCSGCSPDGPQRQAVQGTLTLDGRPLSGVALVFAPTGADQLGATAVATTGKFSLDRSAGPSVGRHFVTLDVIQPDLEEYAQLRQSGKRALSTVKIPARYAQLGTLDADVQAGTENVFKFALTSRPR